MYGKPTSASKGGLVRLIGIAAFSTILSVELLFAPLQARAAEGKTKENPEYTAALEELDRLTEAYSALASEQDETYAQLQEVRDKIADNEARIADVQKDVESNKDELAKRQEILADQVSSDYKQGNVSLLSIVLSASSFEDVFSKVYYFQSVCQSEATKIEAVNSVRAELQKQQDELTKLKQELQDKESSLEGLYEQQSSQASEMYDQQVAAANLLSSLPKEVQEELGDDSSELISESQAVLEAQEEEESQQKSEDSEQGSDQSSTSSQTTDDNKDTATSSDESTNKPSESNNKPKTEEKKEEEKPAANNPQPQPSTSSGTQQAVLDAAYSTSGSEALSKGWGCAGWVYTVFRNSGVYDRKPTCAAWYYNNWCYTSDRSQIQPGMVVAVSTWTGTSSGRIYGHVGIYVGNNTVRHLSSGAVREISLDQWIKRYGTTVTPCWGWNGGIALS